MITSQFAWKYRSHIDSKTLPENMESEEEEYCSFYYYLEGGRKKRPVSKCWVHEIFNMPRQQGEYRNFLQEVRMTDPESHFRYIWMCKERFDHLFSEVSVNTKYTNISIIIISFSLDHCYPIDPIIAHKGLKYLQLKD